MDWVDEGLELDQLRLAYAELEAARARLDAAEVEFIAAAIALDKLRPGEGHEELLARSQRL